MLASQSNRESRKLHLPSAPPTSSLAAHLSCTAPAGAESRAGSPAGTSCRTFQEEEGGFLVLGRRHQLLSVWRSGQLARLPAQHEGLSCDEVWWSAPTPCGGVPGRGHLSVTTGVEARAGSPQASREPLPAAAHPEHGETHSRGSAHLVLLAVPRCQHNARRCAQQDQLQSQEASELAEERVPSFKPELAVLSQSCGFTCSLPGIRFMITDTRVRQVPGEACHERPP